MKLASLVVLLVCVTAWGFCISQNEVDTNNDGKVDQWIEYPEEGVTLMKFDRDFDGSIDYVVKVDEIGNKLYEELDYDYDGFMDDFYFYSTGVLIRREVDTNFDGAVDLWVYLTEGVYVERYERDTDFDGEIDLVKKFGME